MHANAAARPETSLKASLDSARRLRAPVPGLRRTVFFTLVLLSTAAAALFMLSILQANGIEPIEIAILVLFTVNFVWIALSFWSAVAGLVLCVFGRDPITLRPLRQRQTAPPTAITTRTAIVVPIYNENPHRVFAGVEAIYTSLADAGGLNHFELFLLSDTTRDEIAAAERQHWAAFCRRFRAEGRVFYRRRTPNTGRKAGNIADFLSRWGLRYDHTVVLDADSVMSGETLLELVRLMQANPRVGLIQTMPVPVRQTTSFARFLQFGARLYGPVLANGVGFWQLGESNYWGHNAILRTKAFLDHCGLPVLPGKPPLGGEILSHDYVEAALLRRAGWFVCFVPDLGGSYEELPSNIIDYATRDRRWCQGNLQHLKLLSGRGFHPLSRLHFLTGAFAFLSSPLWLLLLILSTAAIVERAIVGFPYFTPGYQLFPEWPISKLAETVSLFGVTLALLFLPKLFGWALALVNPADRKGFGGAGKLTLSVVLETLFSTLIAPVMMGLHTYFVFSLLLGRAIAWNPQSRSERGLRVGEAFSYLGLMFAGGLAWGALILIAAPDYIWWILPVLAGLVLSIPVSVLSSRGAIGLRAQRHGLLLTPEETAPPAELKRLAETLDRPPPTPEETAPLADAPEAPPVRWTPMEPQRLDRKPASSPKTTEPL